MKIILPSLKQYCIDTFGQNSGEKVYNFYSKTLQVDCTTPNAQYKFKEKAKKNMYIPSNERRLRHITNLVEQYPTNVILKAVDTFLEKYKSGELSSLSMNYFSGFVKNTQLKYTSEKQEDAIKKSSSVKHEVKEPDSILCKVDVVCKNPKADPENPLDVWDYIYRCPSHNKEFEGFDVKNGKCPHCHLDIDFDSAEKLIKNLT